MQARAILTKLAETFPAVTRFEGELAQSHQGIGSIQDLTDRPAGGPRIVRSGTDDLAETGRRQPVDDELSKQAGHELLLHGHRAGSARAGPPRRPPSYKKAVAIMERLAKLQPNGYDLYNLACFRSLLSGIAARPGLRHDGRRRSQSWANRPSRRCAGPSPRAWRTSRISGRTPTSIPCARARTFRLLLMDLAFPAEPFATSASSTSRTAAMIRARSGR